MPYPITPRHDVVSFTRGNHLYQIAKKPGDDRFVGLRDGRVVAFAENRFMVMKALIRNCRA